MIGYAPGVTSKSVKVKIVDDNGLGVTGLLAATFPAVYYWLAGANATVSISLSDLSTLTTAYSSGGVKEIDSTHARGDYRLDMPDTAWVTAGKISILGDVSGKHLLCEVIDVGYPQVDVRQAIGNNVATTTNGILDVNAKNWGNATVTGMPMPTYTQPTGFLAASFPTNLASPTNITAGTITTVTNVTNGVTLAASQHVIVDSGTVTTLTNLPAITSNWLTSAGIAAGAITDAAIALPSEASGEPSTILAMIRRLWERGTRKRVRDRNAGTVTLRNAADNGNLETCTQSTTGLVDTIGPNS